VTTLRPCADCGVHTPIDDIHTQHDVECALVAHDLMPHECTCTNWADVCEACCNVCNPPSSLPHGESETP
jgi:hypothetical protein